MKAPKKVPLPPSSNISQGNPDAILNDMIKGVLKRKKGESESSNPIAKAYNTNSYEILDAHITTVFYSGGLSFHLARNPYYMSSYAYVVNHPLSGYLPPSYSKLRTTLLKNERDSVERMLQPIKGTWKQKSVIIVTDEWSDSQRRPLINFMAVTEGGPMFLKAIDASEEKKDK